MNVLINRTDAIGDTLLSLPVAKFIKSKFQQAKVAFIVSPRSGDLIKLCEDLDEVFIFDPKSSKEKQKECLDNIFETFKADAYFHFGGSFLPSKYAWKKKIPLRGGLKSRLISFFLLNKGVRQRRTSEGKHESLYNLELIAPLGSKIDKENWREFVPSFKLCKELQKKVKIELSRPQGEKLIIIHPGMSGHTLNWPIQHYGELIIKLRKRSNVFIIVSYTPSDAPFIDPLKDFLIESKENGILFFDGSKEGLVHFSHLLSNANLFIGPSTGTTHIANALGIPQIGLYSPIKAQSEKRWGTYKKDENVKLLSPPVDCPEEVKCSGSSCPYYPCMNTINVNEVLQKSFELLQI